MRNAQVYPSDYHRSFDLPTVYHRLYARLRELIPHFERAKVGAEFFAAPRVAGDMAMTCRVADIQRTVLVLELRHDQLVNGEAPTAPWLVFNANTLFGTAELVAVNDEWVYPAGASGISPSNTQRLSMNTYAVNWLASMQNLHSIFRPAPAERAIAA